MKKKMTFILVITGLLIIFSPLNDVGAASYNTKASITFIKSEEDSSEENESEAEVIPSGDIIEMENEITETYNSQAAASILPKTATNIYSILFLGIIILIVGTSILIYNSRKNK